jgi:hypothetical protein
MTSKKENINTEKYPHAAAFLKEHPEFSIDQAISFLEQTVK